LRSQESFDEVVSVLEEQRVFVIPGDWIWKRKTRAGKVPERFEKKKSRFLALIAIGDNQ
jgi:hypothetical protein